MGRQVKRVDVSFDWPLKKVWAGYVNPHYEMCKECPCCAGTGHNPATRQLADDWHDSENFGRTWGYHYHVGPDGRHADHPPWMVWGQTRRWSDRLTQDEADALADAGRLRHAGLGERPTAEQVNEWSRNGVGHDAINRWICIEARARRLGVFGKCHACGGSGELWATEEARRMSEEWAKTDPPAGDGWQMWETTTEGSPISPVFATPDELAAWLSASQASAFGDQRATREQWLRMILAGWAPSAGLIDGRLVGGVEFVAGAD